MQILSKFYSKSTRKSLFFLNGTSAFSQWLNFEDETEDRIVISVKVT